MGAWGSGPFDNDTAADWAGDLADTAPGERLAFVGATLQAAVDAADYLDADDAMNAVAAAAVVASLLPEGPVLDENYGPEADVLAGVSADPALVDLAARALHRVLADDSEWRELWEEADGLDEASRSLEPLLAALHP